MRIEVTEEKLSDTDPDTGMHYSLTKGDILTVPDDYGHRLCDLGWATDTAGKVKSGERKPGPALLTPKKKTVAAKTRGGK